MFENIAFQGGRDCCRQTHQPTVFLTTSLFLFRRLFFFFKAERAAAKEAAGDGDESEENDVEAWLSEAEEDEHDEL